MSLQPDLQQILSQAISFVLLLVVLRRFAWGPLLKMLDERRARIEDGFRKIADGKAELNRLQQELHKRLATIEDEARTRLQQAALEGKRLAMQIQEDARAQALATVQKAKVTIELEIAKAKVTLRDEVADMTLDAVERLLRHKLDDKSDERLVAGILDELERPAQPRT